jgi:CysZ protein
MLEAAAKAVAQMLSPPFRAVLLRSVLLAIVILIALGVGTDRLVVALLRHGFAWLENVLPAGAATPLNLLEWLVAVAAGLGVITAGVFLIPAATAIVASLFADEIAEAVERTYYPADPVGTALPLGQALVEGGKAAVLTLLVYLCAAPFMLLAGLGFVLFFLATAYLQGRIYFELAAMRFASPHEARRLRRMHQGTVFMAGLLIAGFLSIPIVSLATPLFAVALMVHVHKDVTRRGALLPAPSRR